MSCIEYETCTEGRHGRIALAIDRYGNTILYLPMSLSLLCDVTIKAHHHPWSTVDSPIPLWPGHKGARNERIIVAAVLMARHIRSVSP